MWILEIWDRCVYGLISSDISPDDWVPSQMMVALQSYVSLFHSTFFIGTPVVLGWDLPMRFLCSSSDSLKLLCQIQVHFIYLFIHVFIFTGNGVEYQYKNTAHSHDSFPSRASKTQNKKRSSRQCCRIDSNGMTLLSENE